MRIILLCASTIAQNDYTPADYAPTDYQPSDYTPNDYQPPGTNGVPTYYDYDVDNYDTAEVNSLGRSLGSFAAPAAPTVMAEESRNGDLNGSSRGLKVGQQRQVLNQYSISNNQISNINFDDGYRPNAGNSPRPDADRFAAKTTRKPKTTRRAPTTKKTTRKTTTTTTTTTNPPTIKPGRSRSDEIAYDDYAYYDDNNYDRGIDYTAGEYGFGAAGGRAVAPDGMSCWKCHVRYGTAGSSGDLWQDCVSDGDYESCPHPDGAEASCQITEYKFYGITVDLRVGCKQTTACNSNFMQNRQIGNVAGRNCRPESPFSLSKCYQCCGTDDCFNESNVLQTNFLTSSQWIDDTSNH